MTDTWPEIPKDNRSSLTAGVIFLALWLLLRSWGSYSALHPEDGSLRLSGADSYFHLRHAESVLQNYPHLLRYDPMTAFPHTERGLNQGFYDLFVATLSKASFGLLSPMQILIWFSPLFTGLAFVLLGAWLWRAVSPWCCLLFYGSLLAYPGALQQVVSTGDGDHHAFEVFLSVILVLSLSKALQDDKALPWIMLPAFTLYVFFISWAGAALHLFFTGLSFFVMAFLNREPQQVKGLMLKGVCFGLITSTLPYFTSIFAPDYINWQTSYLVFVAGGLGLALGYPLLLPLAHKTPKKYRLVLALLIFLSLAALSQVSEKSAAALNTFLSPRSSAIAEHANVSITLLFAWFGFQSLGLLTAPILAYHRGASRRFTVPLVYGLGLTAFWMYTRDFNYYATAVIAATAAYSLSKLPWKAWTGYLLLALAVLAVLPIPSNRLRPWLSPLEVRQNVLHTNGIEQASAWLRNFREKLDKNEVYGLVAPWDLGNVLAYTTHTPVGWSQTHSTKLAELFYESDTDKVYDQLSESEKPFRFLLIPSRNVQDKYGTEMILAGKDPSTVFQEGPPVEWKGKSYQIPVPNEKYGDTLLAKLFDGLGHNAGHFRLVYESPQQMVRTVQIQSNLSSFAFVSLEVSDKEAEALRPILRLKNQVHETSRGLLVNPFLSPDVRIFEMVPGAMVTGKTSPHARVGAFLSLSSPHRPEPQIITWKVFADNQGHFKLRLPYATKQATHDLPGSIVVNSSYKLEVDGKTQDVSVTEEQVQSGAEIPVD